MGHIDRVPRGLTVYQVRWTAERHLTPSGPFIDAFYLYCGVSQFYLGPPGWVPRAGLGLGPHGCPPESLDKFKANKLYYIVSLFFPCCFDKFEATKLYYVTVSLNFSCCFDKFKATKLFYIVFFTFTCCLDKFKATKLYYIVFLILPAVLTNLKQVKDTIVSPTFPCFFDDFKATYTLPPELELFKATKLY